MNEEQKNPKGGPRTPEGKAKCSGNSLIHGLSSSTIIIPGEDPAAFEALVDEFEKDYEPETATQVVLVHNLAKFHWLENRAIRLQQQAFENPEKIDTKWLELMMRYQTTNHRAFVNTLKTLEASQKERRRVQKEFVSQEEENEEIIVLYDGGYSDKTGKPYVRPEPEETDEEFGDEKREFLRPPGKLA